MTADKPVPVQVSLGIRSGWCSNEACTERLLGCVTRLAAVFITSFQILDMGSRLSLNDGLRLPSQAPENIYEPTPRFAARNLGAQLHE